MLYYGYIKNYCGLIAFQLSKQKELDAEPKSIQKFGQLNKLRADHNDESMFILTTLEKINEIRLKFSQGRVTVLQKMTNYQEARNKLTNTQLNKLKSAARNNTGYRNNIKNK